MGKRFNNKNKRSRDDANQQPKEDGTPTSNNNRKSYQSAFHDRESIQNEAFETYYKDNIVPAAEWDTMITSMRELLPIAFRVSNINTNQKQILDMLNGDCFGLPTEPTTIEGPDGTTATLSRPQPLKFYRPKNNAFHFDMGRRELKRFPQMQKFREFLILQDGVGNITRQEAVSMIPPLLLDVKPHHVVLDACAAPGSKTSQLLEGLHSGLAPGEVPSGIVIANDANPDRAYMLVHQLKRLGSPSFMVTTHEGQTFPTLFAPKHSSITSTENGFREGSFRTNQDKTNAYFTTTAVPDLDGKSSEEPVQLAPVLFDRILCDVPCGGDGTMRKTPTVWSNWQLNNSYALHPLQLMIAWRALQLLKVGGLMVYSTCSINPIEDEAVVLELLRRSNGTVELVKIQDILPELEHIPGQNNWKDFAEIPARKGVPAQLVQLTCLADILGLPEDVQRKMHPSELSPALLKKVHEEAKEHVKKLVAEWEVHVETKRAEFPTIEAAKENETKTRLESQADQSQQQDAQAQDQAQDGDDKKKGKKGGNKQGPKKTFKFVVPGFVRELLRLKTLSVPGESNIHYTTRVLPHQQNTGGFYIALLKKVGQLPSLDETLVPVPPVWSMRYDMFNDIYTYDAATHAVAPPGEDLIDASRIAQRAAVQKAQEAKAEAKAAEVEVEVDKVETETKETENDENGQEKEQKEQKSETTVAPNNRKDKKTGQQAIWNSDPFVNSSPDVYECLDKVWGVSEKISLLSRNTSKHYLMSKAVHDIIMCPQNYRLKTVHGGLKAFELDKFFGSIYNNDDVSSAFKLSYPTEKYYRVCQDAAVYIKKYINRQKIDVTKSDMITLLSQAESTHFNDLDAATKAALVNRENRNDSDLNKMIRAGSLLVCYHDPEKNVSIIVSALKRALSISLLVDQAERDAYKHLLGAEVDPATISAKGEEEEEVQLEPAPTTE